MEGSPEEQIDDSLAEKMSLVATLEEDILWATSHDLQEAEYLYGEPAERLAQVPGTASKAPPARVFVAIDAGTAGSVRFRHLAEPPVVRQHGRSNYKSVNLNPT